MSDALGVIVASAGLGLGLAGVIHVDPAFGVLLATVFAFIGGVILADPDL